MKRRADLVSIVAGATVAGLGLLLLLDRTGVVDLRFDSLAPAVLATVGAVLVATGLSRD